MFNYLWPLFMIIGSNVCYNLSAKGTPESINPFISLTVTYIIGAVFSFAIFMLSSQNKNVTECILNLNWASYALGFAIVGLETGYIYLYRAGWSVSRGPLTANITLALILLVIGRIVFKETISLKQIIGIILCLTGLFFISSK